MLVSTTTYRLLIKISFSLARVRRNSQWIYSNKAQEMSDARKGNIFVSSNPGKDSYNCTLRMHKTLQKSHLVLSQHPFNTTQLLKSIANKVRLASEQNEQGIEVFKDSGQIVSYSERESKKKELDSVVEHSKHLQMAMEVQKINRSNNDRQNKLLKKQQEQLNNFIQSSNTKEKLQIYKRQNGFPRIVQLLSNLSKIEQLRNGGINIFCLVEQDESLPSKALFSYLQEKRIPYEVLPGVSHIINLLASSGFPADRFAIEYFPTPITQALQKRKPMKMTVGMVLQKKNTINALEAIKKIYGGHHMIYLQNQQGKMIFRGKANQLQTELLANIEGNTMRMAIAPFISTFNEQLKEQRNHVERLYGEAMSNNTHEVRIEFINKELKELLKRKDTRKISVNSLMQELIARAGKEKAAAISAKMLGLKQKQAQILLSRAQSQTVMDHLGIEQHIRKK